MLCCSISVSLICANKEIYYYYYYYYYNKRRRIFLTLEDVELNQKGQQLYILVQNDLNKLHFTSLIQYRKLRNIAYWLEHTIFVFDVKHQ